MYERLSSSIQSMTLIASYARRLFGQVWQRPYAQLSHKVPLINDALKDLGQVRLISENGKDCGLMAVTDAINRAKQAGLDLIQVGKAESVVVKLVDYTAMETARRKSFYDKRKKGKESKIMERREGILKQVRLSPAIDRNDMQVKMRQAREFLKAGYRIKIFMRFKRGQGGLKEHAKAALMAAAEELQNVGLVQGLEKCKGLPELFADNDAEQNKEGVVRKKPLEFFMRPLPRKQREQYVDEASPS